MPNVTARRRLRDGLDAALAGGPPVVGPLTLDPLTARLAEDLGYGAGYLSGGALGYQLAVSEALLTITELAETCRRMTVRSSLPIVVDGGVGFGDPVHVQRAMWEFEAAGAAAVELEDQVAPKRVSHHRGVEHLVPVGEMVDKIAAAVETRSDPDFLVIARTGAVRHEGFEAALDRLERYREAGADLLLLFPTTDEEWAAAPGRSGAPLVAMVSVEAVGGLPAGWPLVVDPFTGQVLAYRAVRDAYRRFRAEGTTGHAVKELMGVYRELAPMAGLEALYDLERRTTEPGT
jgi:2-methylisocitrate lyase-like PEP mutase family enzyme